MLQNRKQEGQILLLALLSFHCSQAGTVLLHRKGNKNKECGEQLLRAAQPVPFKEKPQGKGRAGKPIAMQPPLLKPKVLEHPASCSMLAGALLYHFLLPCLCLRKTS